MTRPLLSHATFLLNITRLTTTLIFADKNAAELDNVLPVLT
ncbi:hypothetical protein ACT3RN_07770 [Psychrobacter sp. AOP5-GZ1-6]